MTDSKQIVFDVIYLGNGDRIYELRNADNFTYTQLRMLGSIISGANCGNGGMVPRVYGKMDTKLGEETTEYISSSGRLPDASCRYYTFAGSIKNDRMSTHDSITFRVAYCGDVMDFTEDFLTLDNKDNFSDIKVVDFHYHIPTFITAPTPVN